MPADAATIPTSGRTDAPVTTSTPLPGAVDTRVPDQARGGGDWLLWGGVALMIVAALIAASVIVPRRRARRMSGDALPTPRDEAPVVSPIPPRAASSAPHAASGPTIAFRPTRIGLNLLSMTVDGEVVLANETPSPVEGIRVRAAALAATAGHEAAVAALHREPAGRLAAPAFALAAGETRAVRIITAVARDRIDPLTVAGRPMVVPLVAVTVDWRDLAGDHRRTRAFAVGIERVDSAKLSPVWLDQDMRSFDAVAARPHGDPIG